MIVRGYDETVPFSDKDFDELLVRYAAEIQAPLTFEERALDRQVTRLVLGEQDRPKRLRRRSPNRVLWL